MFAVNKGFQSYTPPGYFNYSASQAEITKQLNDWFNLAMQQWVDQLNVFDSFFRLWSTHDYSTATIYRTPYVAYKLNQYGFSWFTGTDTQAVYLLEYIRRGYSLNTAENIFFLFNYIEQSPLLWCNGYPQIVFGTQIPSRYMEALTIFSTSVSAPATPPNTPYTPMEWSAPSGWSQEAQSATYFSRGYLSGSNIVWTSPLSTGGVYAFIDVATLGDLPAAGTPGRTAGVLNDGSGDVGAIYFDDGSSWRKTTTPNANQGLIENGVIPTPRPRSVFAPVSSGPAITSESPPPADGPSGGYGMYSGLSGFTIRSREIDIGIELTEAGYNNLGIIINLLRRIKPTRNKLVLFYTVEGLITDPVEITIKDSGEIA